MDCPPSHVSLQRSSPGEKGGDGGGGGGDGGCGDGAPLAGRGPQSVQSVP